MTPRAPRDERPGPSRSPARPSPPSGTLRSRFLAVAGPIFRSEARWWAGGLLGVLLLFIVGLNGLNVAASYVCRNFTTAVADKESDRAVTYALLWAGAFAALTVVAVFKGFTEDRLRLGWRQWLTEHLLGRYMVGRAYYHLTGRAGVDNPDQRLSEDVRTFTEQTLALLLILTNSVITLISFAGVLWSITPWLVLAAVVYTALGSVMTVLLGRRLVKYDVQQYRKEADLRYDLIQVRDHAEQVAFLGGEPEEELRLLKRLGVVVANMKRIIGLSRNISFFTTGYDYLSQLIPLAIVGSLYIRDRVEFGAVAQAQIAFAFVMAAFSIIVKEFQRLSTFGAVIERLGSFSEAVGAAAGAAVKSPLEVAEDPARVALEGVTLVTPRDGRVLLKDVWLEVPRGGRLLVVGPSGSGRTSLLRAAAGLWTAGQGRVARPPAGETFFLPQQPYLRRGALRDQLVYGIRTKGLTDDRVLAALEAVGFADVLGRLGGLGAEQDWGSVLSAGEQQQVAFARLLLAEPRFAFLDEPTSALDQRAARRLYEALSRTPAGYVSVSSDPALREFHETVLEFRGEGAWTAGPIAEKAEAARVLTLAPRNAERAAQAV